MSLRTIFCDKYVNKYQEVMGLLLRFKFLQEFKAIKENDKYLSSLFCFLHNNTDDNSSSAFRLGICWLEPTISIYLCPFIFFSVFFWLDLGTPERRRCRTFLPRGLDSSVAISCISPYDPIDRTHVLTNLKCILPCRYVGEYCKKKNSGGRRYSIRMQRDPLGVCRTAYGHTMLGITIWSTSEPSDQEVLFDPFSLGHSILISPIRA